MQEPSMRSLGVLLAVALLLLTPPIELAARQKITPGTPRDQIREMNPADVDASDLPLDPISSLHVTGAPQDVDLAKWRLALSGAGLVSPKALTYQDLQGMPTVTRRAILICPGVFADYAEWQGVPLEAVLARAGLSASWSRISFVSLDGYQEQFTRDEVHSHLLFLALKVNGQVLPRDHGFPIRLVAVDLYGGRWVKWIKEIRVE